MLIPRKTDIDVEMCWNSPAYKALLWLEQFQFSATTLDGPLIFQHVKVNIYLAAAEQELKP